MINAYLMDTVTLMLPVKNDYNEITGWTESNIKARWTRKDRVVEITGGNQVVSTAQILIKNQTITNSHRIKYGGVKYTIVDIKELKDFSNRGLEVFLQ